MCVCVLVGIFFPVAQLLPRIWTTVHQPKIENQAYANKIEGLIYVQKKKKIVVMLCAAFGYFLFCCVVCNCWIMSMIDPQRHHLPQMNFLLLKTNDRQRRHISCKPQRGWIAWFMLDRQRQHSSKKCFSLSVCQILFCGRYLQTATSTYSTNTWIVYDRAKFFWW